MSERRAGKKWGRQLQTSKWLPHALIALCFFLAHGLTAILISPLQARLLPNVTDFASLLYLPHGVRVLSVWLFGWRAVPALFIGNYLAMFAFSPAGLWELISPKMIEAVFLGSVAALVAFGILNNLLGRKTFGREAAQTSWKIVIAAAALASLLNSVSQTLIFRGFLEPSQLAGLWSSYVIGDILGTVVLFIGLMAIFRWARTWRDESPKA